MEKMPMKDIFEKYVEEVCSTCKAKCNESNKGIYVVFGEDKKVQCIDYIKDETKIKKPEKQLVTTAKHTKPVMRDIV